MRFISGIFGFILLALALCFALSNRQPTTVSLWPLDFTVEAPLCLMTLGLLFLGFLLGIAVGWFGNLPHRFEARRLRKEISSLNGKIMDLQQTVISPVRNDPYIEAPKSKWRFWEKKA